MPLLSIETNQTLPKESVDSLLESASSLVSSTLGKSENYVMVRFSHNGHMLFSGNHQPLACLQLRSIGLPQDATAELSRVLCELVESELKVPKNRTYIEFIDAPRKMWGYDGGTF